MSSVDDPQNTPNLDKSTLEKMMWRMVARIERVRDQQELWHQENAEILRRIDANLSAVAVAYKSHGQRLTQLEARVFGNGGAESVLSGEGGLDA